MRSCKKTGSRSPVRGSGEVSTKTALPRVVVPLRSFAIRNTPKVPLYEDPGNIAVPPVPPFEVPLGIKLFGASVVGLIGYGIAKLVSLPIAKNSIGRMANLFPTASDSSTMVATRTVTRSNSNRDGSSSGDDSDLIDTPSEVEFDRNKGSEGSCAVLNDDSVRGSGAEDTTQDLSDTITLNGSTGVPRTSSSMGATAATSGTPQQSAPTLPVLDDRAVQGD